MCEQRGICRGITDLEGQRDSKNAFPRRLVQAGWPGALGEGDAAHNCSHLIGNNAPRGLLQRRKLSHRERESRRDKAAGKPWSQDSHPGHLEGPY